MEYYYLSTGDIVTTFKVGEDRFLNSLLVSENGHICVCGDEVQKPFPLIVWNLQKRKLIYDLRIQGHEFVTQISAITADGHYVVCACKVSVKLYIKCIMVLLQSLHNQNIQAWMLNSHFLK